MAKGPKGRGLKAQLTRSANKKHLTGAKRNAYIQGTMHRVAYRYYKKTGHTGFKKH